MLYNLGDSNSVVGQYIAELRSLEVQKDSLRFRRNLERLGEISAYEISKTLKYQSKLVTTPLGTLHCSQLSEQPILATILRAGLPLHSGLLSYFDKADNAFISAYRKHERKSEEKFTIEIEYLSCPKLDGRVLVIADPMLATGASMVGVLEKLHDIGTPSSVHIVCAIACTQGISVVSQAFPNSNIWTGAVDNELNSLAYIVPGMGDAGDLAYGQKIQH